IAVGYDVTSHAGDPRSIRKKKSINQGHPSLLDFLIPLLFLLLHKPRHDLRLEDGTIRIRRPRYLAQTLIVKHGSNCGNPPLPPLHERLGEVPDSGPRRARRSHKVAPPARPAGPLVLL